MAENHANVGKISAPILVLTVDRYAAFKSWKVKWTDYVTLSGIEEKGKPYM